MCIYGVKFEYLCSGPRSRALNFLAIKNAKPSLNRLAIAHALMLSIYTRKLIKLSPVHFVILSCVN